MKPNYYAVLSAEVRYSDITPNAKLLYAEINCLLQYEWQNASQVIDYFGRALW